MAGITTEDAKTIRDQREVRGCVGDEALNDAKKTIAIYPGTHINVKR